MICIHTHINVCGTNGSCGSCVYCIYSMFEAKSPCTVCNTYTMIIIYQFGHMYNKTCLYIRFGVVRLMDFIPFERSKISFKFLFLIYDFILYLLFFSLSLSLKHLTSLLCLIIFWLLIVWDWAAWILKQLNLCFSSS